MPEKNLYLDDLYVGQTFVSGEHLLDEAQIIAYARQFDPQVFHLDPEAAKHTFFQGLAASGWHTASISMRLVTESIPLADGVIGGGMEELAWPQPTRPGDRLHVESEIVEIIPSQPKPNRAMLRVLCQTKNQRGEVLQRFRPKMLAFKRPAA
ncbi:MaoC family dehydratase [Comamonas terrigena]|uniref:MaoC family dehydratase n=1 Tax=Comamonas terrigena TaxID=32013 RepID=UPI00244729F8|nr:MaoC family dehydratase [Comamonas terrigena]MDH0048254.1 MaoC family dehydratase [Comamonas terrigena]MDH0510662.1 MaoC family dehydratase [Comamonas terrigena]MDH1090431.1 MaoC family dehydratase [Comamonas terrigena]MDH1499414.1 MaoC family dehydratase [Comamonas terrigena]